MLGFVALVGAYILIGLIFTAWHINYKTLEWEDPLTKFDFNDVVFMTLAWPIWVAVYLFTYLVLTPIGYVLEYTIAKPYRSFVKALIEFVGEIKDLFRSE